MWHTWFDRDLAIAGRVIVREQKDGSESYSHQLIRIEEPIMRIPTLAIHLDRYLLVLLNLLICVAIIIIIIITITFIYLFIYYY